MHVSEEKERTTAPGGGLHRKVGDDVYRVALDRANEDTFGQYESVSRTLKV